MLLCLAFKPIGMSYRILQNGRIIGDSTVDSVLSLSRLRREAKQLRNHLRIATEKSLKSRLNFQLWVEEIKVNRVKIQAAALI